MCARAVCVWVLCVRAIVRLIVRACAHTRVSECVCGKCICVLSVCVWRERESETEETDRQGQRVERDMTDRERERERSCTDMLSTRAVCGSLCSFHVYFGSSIAHP